MYFVSNSMWTKEMSIFLKTIYSIIDDGTKQVNFVIVQLFYVET